MDATLLIRDGSILAIGKKVDLPKDAVRINMHGLHLWPALIDPYSDLGLSSISIAKNDGGSAVGARHWNRALHPELRADELIANDAARTKELRKQGFATVITHRMDGIARGTSAAFVLDDGPLPKV